MSLGPSLLSGALGTIGVCTALGCADAPPGASSRRRKGPALVQLSQPQTALVLSGGGARGAYEVGVATGIAEVLGRSRHEPSAFQIFTGTSVGAVNAAWLAAHGDRGDLNLAGLSALWRSLRMPVHVRLDPRRLLLSGAIGHRIDEQWRRFRKQEDRQTLGASLLDPEPLDEMVRNAIPWQRLHHNLESGRVSALVVAALQVTSGRTAVFYEMAEGLRFRPSSDPRRASLAARITHAHVLASAAIPLVFPARRIDGEWYCDGGLRFNTPIAPAIRAGADRLVVISLQHRPTEAPQISPQAYLNPLFLVAKVANALLLDPVSYDLQVLDRLNRMVEVLHDTLTPQEWGRVAQVLTNTRGMPYRQLDTLVFSPSKDLGLLAARYLRERGSSPIGGWLGDLLLRRAKVSDAAWEGDLASYLLFDGRFAERLIELGRRDVCARADEVRAWFARPLAPSLPTEGPHSPQRGRGQV